MSKVVAVFGGVFGAVALAWGGATFYSSSAFDKAMTQAVSQSTQQLVFTQIQSDHGVLSSSGTLGWRMALDCDNRIEKISGEVNYSASHAPRIAGATSVQADIVVTGHHGDMLKRMGNPEKLVSLHGSRGYTGRWDTTFSTPKLAFDADGVALRISASKGSWVGDAKSGAFNWSLNQVTGATDGGATKFSAKAMGIEFNFDDVELGLGVGVYRVGEVLAQGKQGEMEILNLALKQSSEMNGEAFNTVVEPSIQSFSPPRGPKMRNLGMKVSMRGFDRQAIESLSGIQSKSACADFFENDDQLMMIEKAVADVLDRGWIFAIDDIKAQVDDGSFDGNLKVNFAGVDRARSDVSLASRISIDGKVTALGAIIPAGFTDMLLGTGYLLEAPGGNGVTGSVNLQNGQLKINGQPDQDIGAQIEFFLNIGDSQMQQWRAGLDNGQSTLVGLMHPNRI